MVKEGAGVRAGDGGAAQTINELRDVSEWLAEATNKRRASGACRGLSRVDRDARSGLAPTLLRLGKELPTPPGPRSISYELQCDDATW